jgi:hypothetical protein
MQPDRRSERRSPSLETGRRTVDNSARTARHIGRAIVATTEEFRSSSPSQYLDRIILCTPNVLSKSESKQFKQACSSPKFKVENKIQNCAHVQCRKSDSETETSTTVVCNNDMYTNYKPSTICARVAVLFADDDGRNFESTFELFSRALALLVEDEANKPT